MRARDIPLARSLPLAGLHDRLDPAVPAADQGCRTALEQQETPRAAVG
jgi:hypothetical protein